MMAQAYGAMPCGMAQRQGPYTQGGTSVLTLKYATPNGEPSAAVTISGLPVGTDQASLNQMFTSHGLTVHHIQVGPDQSGQGAIAAMVNLASAEEAQVAIQSFNGQTVVATTTQNAASTPPAHSSNTVALTGMGATPSVMHVKFAGIDGTPSDNLFVTGLPLGVDSQMLTDTFVSIGFTVYKARVIPDTRNIGGVAGMVQLASVAEAHAAIAQLDGQVVAAPESKASSGPVTSQILVAYAGPQQLPSDKLYVSNLPGNCRIETVNEAFTAAGITVRRSQLLPGASAMVQVDSVQIASLGIQKLNGQPLTSQPLKGTGRTFKGIPSALTGKLVVKFAGKNALPSDNLYITGLPWNCDLDTLNDMFASGGFTVGRSRIMGSGVAMVQVQSSEEAAAAVEIFHDQIVMLDGEDETLDKFKGNHSTWDEWWQQAWDSFMTGQPGPWSQKGKDFKGKGKCKVGVGFGKPGPQAPYVLNVMYKGGQVQSDQLYITNLPPPVDKNTLDLMFANAGFTVLWSTVMKTGMNQTSALVQVGSLLESAAAIELFHGQQVAITAPEGGGGFAGNGCGGCGGNFGSPNPGSFGGNPNAANFGGGVDNFGANFGGNQNATNFGGGDCGGNMGGNFGRHLPMLEAPPKEVGSPTTVSLPKVSKKLSVKYSGKFEPCETILVDGIPLSVDVTAVLRIFTDAGLTVLWHKRIAPTIPNGSVSAMVQLGTKDEAGAAINYLNDQEADVIFGPILEALPPQTHTLTVKFAGAGSPSENIFISGLPHTAESTSLDAMLQGLGLTVQRSNVSPGPSGCVALVKLASPEEAQEAIEKLNGQMVAAS